MWENIGNITLEGRISLHIITGVSRGFTHSLYVKTLELHPSVSTIENLGTPKVYSPD